MFIWKTPAIVVNLQNVHLENTSDSRYPSVCPFGKHQQLWLTFSMSIWKTPAIVVNLQYVHLENTSNSRCQPSICSFEKHRQMSLSVLNMFIWKTPSSHCQPSKCPFGKHQQNHGSPEHVPMEKIKINIYIRGSVFYPM